MLEICLGLFLGPGLGACVLQNDGEFWVGQFGSCFVRLIRIGRRTIIDEVVQMTEAFNESLNCHAFRLLGVADELFQVKGNVFVHENTEELVDAKFKIGLVAVGGIRSNSVNNVGP